MFTDEFWLGDEDEIFAFDLPGRRKRKMAKLTAGTRRAMPAPKVASGKSYPANKALKTPNAVASDKLRHNPMFTTRGQNQPC